MDDVGKLSIDLIIGISIFMVSYIFIAQYIPSIFAEERGEIGLQPVAYRTAALLAEDRGYWTNGVSNGTDWFNHTDTNIRIGLSNGEPNVLTMQRIEGLKDLYENTNYSTVQRALGLYSSGRVYEYNISLQSFSSNSTSPAYVSKGDSTILTIGKIIPEWADVAKHERFVIFSNTTLVSNVSSRIDTPNTATFTFDVTPPVGAFVIIMTDVNDNSTATQPWMQVWFSNPSDYVIDVSGNDTIDIFDITDIINSEKPTEVNIKVHNVKGSTLITEAGTYIGGRIGAKLVVTVW